LQLSIGCATAQKCVFRLAAGFRWSVSKCPWGKLLPPHQNPPKVTEQPAGSCKSISSYSLRCKSTVQYTRMYCVIYVLAYSQFYLYSERNRMLFLQHNTLWSKSEQGAEMESNFSISHVIVRFWSIVCTAFTSISHGGQGITSFDRSLHQMLHLH
jgi:hypothetical protein